jgi:hypothetical protein
VRGKYYWPGWASDIRKAVSECLECKLRRLRRLRVQARVMRYLSEKVGPAQRTLTNVNHKVTQRTKLIKYLPQTRCVLRCRVESSCLNQVICVCSVLSTDHFQVRQARRRYTRLLTGALVHQLILRLIKCPDYPQPPNVAPQQQCSLHE